MHLFIYINCKDNSIVKMEPSDEEFKSSEGDVIKLDDTTYSVLGRSIEEFPEYELLVYKITVCYFKEGENELY